MRGNFSCFCCHLLIFFKINFFEKKKFRNTIRVSNGFDQVQDQHFVGPDLGPNCLQKLSEDDKTDASIVVRVNDRVLSVQMKSLECLMVVTLHASVFCWWSLQKVWTQIRPNKICLILTLVFLSFFLSINTGTIKFWSLRQGVQFWNFEEKTKTKQKNKNKTKKQKNLSAVFLTKWGVP